MLGSNPSADPGPKTDPGCSAEHPVSFPDHSQELRDWDESDKSRGSGGWPPDQLPIPQIPVKFGMRAAAGMLLRDANISLHSIGEEPILKGLRPLRDRVESGSG